VEAAEYDGRAVEFRVLPAALQPVPPGPYRRPWIRRALDTFIVIMSVAVIAVLAAQARRNARAGRGDRRGAMRIALALLGTQAVVLALYRHWTTVPIQSLVALFYSFGVAFSVGLLAWLYYLGLEPYVRRRWPHL